ncbi:MAG TPA: hypothetical protein VFC78_24250 [Tepidisphaeraceae bacterium]|nr:hypothetical protein [Tepidisphaeraceae bacterium]
MLSSIGHIPIGRRYYACRHCKAKQIPWESWAGVTGKHRVTPHAQRMMVLAGSGCSFDEGARNLKELCYRFLRHHRGQLGANVQGAGFAQGPEPERVG